MLLDFFVVKVTKLIGLENVFAANLFTNKSTNKSKQFSAKLNHSLLQSLSPEPWACKLAGINTKEGAIKCCQEIKITSLPNVCRNIPFMQRQDKGWIKGDLSTPFQVFNLGEGSLNLE